MRATMLLRSAAKGKGAKAPYEVWPLFAGIGFVCVFATYRIVTNLAHPDVRKARSGQIVTREPEIKEHH